MAGHCALLDPAGCGTAFLQLAQCSDAEQKPGTAQLLVLAALILSDACCSGLRSLLKEHRWLTLARSSLYKSRSVLESAVLTEPEDRLSG